MLLVTVSLLLHVESPCVCVFAVGSSLTTREVNYSVSTVIPPISQRSPCHPHWHKAETAPPGNTLWLPASCSFSTWLPTSSSPGPSTHFPWYPWPTTNSRSISLLVLLILYSPDDMLTVECLYGFTSPVSWHLAGSVIQCEEVDRSQLSSAVCCL